MESAKTLSLNERLAFFRFCYLCHRTAGLRWVGRTVSPRMLFRWTLFVSYAARWVHSADRRRARYMRCVLAQSYGAAELRTKINRNILYRKWLNNLVYAWPNWADRCGDWAAVEGDEYVREGLAQGRGAVLLSGHAYGFSRLVAPVLAQMNYHVHRAGSSFRGDRALRWGEDAAGVSWKYINYGQDYWRHVRALKELRKALDNNSLVHVSIRGFPSGETRLALDFCHKGFFLDPLLLRVIEILAAPVLPLFAICDSAGKVRLKIYPPLAPRIDAIVQVFAPLYARYLRELPEFSRIWRRVAHQKEGW